MQFCTKKTAAQGTLAAVVILFQIINLLVINYVVVWVQATFFA